MAAVGLTNPAAAIFYVVTALIDKLVPSLSATVVGIAATMIGVESLPAKSTFYTPGMNVVGIVLLYVIIMCAWALTLWSRATSWAMNASKSSKR